jgi:hypothetical protein
VNDDYLWDKSGEPDPEIEQLEQLLGSLRYERTAKALPLPTRAPIQPRRTFKPFLAIAAALLLMLTAGGLWLIFSGGLQKNAAGVAANGVEPVRPSERFNLESISATALHDSTEKAGKLEQPINVAIVSHPDRPRRRPARRDAAATLAAKATPSNRDEKISADEALAAREQLIKALHLTSSKLNQVQKKMQENKSAGPVS